MRLLALLGGQAVALGLTVAFLVVPASAVFLHTYGAGALPYAYLAVAAAGAVVSSLLTVAQRRMPLGRLALAALGVHVVVVASAWVLLARWELAWVTFVLIVLFPLSIPTGFLIVGSQAVRLYDVQTLKRDFPRVVAGFSVGFAVGGLAAAALVGPVGGAANLLLIDVGVALSMMTMVWVTSRQYPGQLLSPPSRPGAGAPRRAVPRLGGLRGLREPLVLLLLGYQVLSAGVTQLLDYIVWERAAAYYPDPHSLARFMGAFGAIINVVSVLFVVFLAGRLLSRRGVGFGLAANPAGVLVVTVVVVAVGAGPGIAAFAYLAAVCAAQVTDIALTDGTTRTSIAATYQGIRRADRLRVQTFVEAAGVPLAVGLVGVFLLVVRALGLDVRAVVWTTAALSVGWLWTAIRAHRSYAAHLGPVLADRSWDPVALRLDTDAHAAVRRLLESADPLDRRTGLEALVDAGAPVVDAALVALSDENAAVRCAALEALAAVRSTERSDVAGVVDALLRDGDPGVRARAGAAISRAEPGRSDDGRRVWRAVLDTDLTASDALTAAAAIPSSALMPDLVALAREPHPAPGLTEALAAHGDRLVPELEQALARVGPPPGLGALMSSVAKGGGERGRAVLVSALLDPRPAVAEAAATALARHSAGPARALDGRVRRAVGAAVDTVLERAGRTALALEGLSVEAAGVEVGATTVVGAKVLPVGTTGEAAGEAAGEPIGAWTTGVEPLRSALQDDFEWCCRRLLTLVGVVMPGVSAERLVAGLASDDVATRALAEELVTVALGGRAGAVLAVVDPRRSPLSGTNASKREPDTRLAEPAVDTRLAEPGSDTRLAERGSDTRLAELGSDTRLAELVQDLALDPRDEWADPWLRASALRVLPAVAPELVADVVTRLGPFRRAVAAEEARDDLTGIVTETLDWLAQLEGSPDSRVSASASAEAELP